MLIIEYAHLPKHFRDGYVVSIGEKRQLVIIEESLSNEKKDVVLREIARKLQSYK